MSGGSVNKVILVGNLGRDPEVRTTQAGQKIVNLRLATNERWKDKQTGEMQERVEWHSIAIFNDNIADVAERYCRKGSSVYIEGQLQTRKWTDQSGQEKYSTEVVISRFKGELTLLGERQQQQQSAPAPRQQPRVVPQASRGSGFGSPRTSAMDELGDEIPF